MDAVYAEAGPAAAGAALAAASLSGAGVSAAPVHGAGSQSTPATSGATFVTVASGTLEGRLLGGTRAFFGIPYAKPPQGVLRFAPPQPAEPWAGTRSASAPRAMCPQLDAGGKALPGTVPPPQDEDCLQLNVFSPARAAAKGLPVMVFLHGGFNTIGNASDYDGSPLSQAGDVVVVAINYRLGALGGLVLPELEQALGHPSGNLGLRDQQLALRWVQQNIAAFGGDPARVTLFGESAGSISTCYHLFAHGSEGLFARAILESGACVARSALGFEKTRQAALDAGRQLVDALCPGASDVVACLRALPASRLGGYLPANVSATDFNGPFSPYPDGELLADRPSALLAAGRVNAVPVVLGTNAREVAFLSSDFYGKAWPLFTDWTALAALELAAPGLLASYGVSSLELPALSVERVNDIGVAFLGDYFFRCPTRALARGLARWGHEAYLYSFEQAPAVHGLELDYVFGWPEGRYSRLYTDAATPPLPGLVHDVQGYWTSFATRGRPSGPVEWPVYRLADDAHLVLSVPIERRSGLARAACDVIDDAPLLAIGP